MKALADSRIFRSARQPRGRETCNTTLLSSDRRRIVMAVRLPDPVPGAGHCCKRFLFSGDTIISLLASAAASRGMNFAVTLDGERR